MANVRLFGGLMLVLLLVNGCGYRLRGSTDVPEALKNVYIFNASPLLMTEVEATLKAGGGKLAKSPNDAGLVVKVMKEDIANRVLSLGSTGKSQESEINYYLRVQFFDNKETELMEEQTIEISREFFNDQTAILAKTNEEQIIRKEIYKQAVRMLMIRGRVAVEKIKK